jgi:hypothetical protein
MSLFWTQFLCSYVCSLTCGAKPRLVPHISGPSAATSADVTAEDLVSFFFFLHLLMQPHQTSFLKYISTQRASTTLEYIMQPLSVNQTHPKMLPRGKLLYIFDGTDTSKKIIKSCYNFMLPKYLANIVAPLIHSIVTLKAIWAVKKLNQPRRTRCHFN